MSRDRSIKDKMADILNAPTDEKVGRTRVAQRRDEHYGNRTEDRMIEAIDLRKKIDKFTQFQEKVEKGLVDPAQIFAGMAPEIAMELLKVALNGETERSRLEAMKDVLDRAGYSKVQKHAVATMDPNTSKEQLVSMILGLNDKSKTVEIEDDGQDQTQEE